MLTQGAQPRRHHQHQPRWHRNAGRRSARSGSSGSPRRAPRRCSVPRLAALGLVWVLYERVLPFTGVLGFWVCWYVVFLLLYAAMAGVQWDRRDVVNKVTTVAFATAGRPRPRGGVRHRPVHAGARRRRRLPHSASSPSRMAFAGPAARSTSAAWPRRHRHRWNRSPWPPCSRYRSPWPTAVFLVRGGRPARAPGPHHRRGHDRAARHHRRAVHLRAVHPHPGHAEKRAGGRPGARRDHDAHHRQGLRGGAPAGAGDAAGGLLRARLQPVAHRVERGPAHRPARPGHRGRAGHGPRDRRNRARFSSCRASPRSSTSTRCPGRR